ncbi:hypothetical protein RCL1_002857 [Eukaryota sp. TZLM3-RCL]
MKLQTPTFRLAQFSDLHFFSDRDFGLSDVFSKRLFSYVNGKMASNRAFDVSRLPNMLIDAHNNSVNNVVISGDVTCLGTAHEYSLVQDCLFSSPFIKDATPLPSIKESPFPVTTNNQIFLTLGNHDHLCASDRPDFSLLSPFIPPEFPRVVSLGNSVDLLLLNSAFGQRLPSSARGKVDIVQREFARSQLKNRTYGSSLVSVLHHSPIRRTLPTHALLEEEQFQSFLMGKDEQGSFLGDLFRTDLCVHGHTHHPEVVFPFEGEEIMVSDAGSSTCIFRQNPNYLIYEFQVIDGKSRVTKVIKREFVSSDEVVESVRWSMDFNAVDSN